MAYGARGLSFEDWPAGGPNRGHTGGGHAQAWGQNPVDADSHNGLDRNDEYYGAYFPRARRVAPQGNGEGLSVLRARGLLAGWVIVAMLAGAAAVQTARHWPEPAKGWAAEVRR